MRKKRFTEAQIVNILREGEAGVRISDLCRRHGIGESTYYSWKSKYEGLSTSDLKRLKSLEAENSHLKRMYANLSLDHESLKDIIEKKLNLPLSNGN